MDDYTSHLLNSYLSDIKARYRNEQRRLEQLKGYEFRRLKTTRVSNNKKYYSVYIPEENTYKYLGPETSDEVLKIKEAHYLASSTKRLDKEICAVEQFFKQSPCISYEDINAKLAKVYQNATTITPPSAYEKTSVWKSEMEKYKAAFPPFRPDELIHPTHDGSKVRSKSEALIYNYLLDLGTTFIYELPLRITVDNKRTILLPDFSILSEIEYKKVIYIEHQGMMSMPKYRTKFNDAVYKYWLNDYLPERDVFFTFDSPNGGFDDSVIRNIILHHIRLPNF